MKAILLSGLLAARKTTIGGQALIEGLLMIGPDKRAMAVRKADGEIIKEDLAPIRMTRAAKILFVRGSVRLFRQLVSGTKAMIRSAELAEASEQEAEKAKEDLASEATPGAAKKRSSRFFARLMRRFDAWAERHSDALLYVAAVLGILFSVVLFILLPNFITGILQQLIGFGQDGSRSTTVGLNLLEGLIRIILFVTYLALTSRMKDIKRVWMYHGAEHKTIACYEEGRPLSVENVKTYSRFHPRCGTAFLFIVLIVSIILFSFFGWWSRWINLLIRFALVPVVAGIAYEIIRLAGRFDNRLTRLISAPGLFLQRLTTAEPDDGMLEVAITAMEAVRPVEEASDRW